MITVHRNAAMRVPASRTRRSFPVETVTVHPGVWREAMRLANRDPRRIRIITPRRVEVLNN